MQNELISVIVPVYNVENYLSRCVDSIINQTYSNLEIILVDDGSTDSSGIICDEYKKKDKRIIVIHQENGGLSQARNSGMKVMKGKYVTFVDSDDYISPDYIKYLFNLIVRYKADISICLYRNFYEDGTLERKKKNKRISIGLFSGQEAAVDLCYQKHIPNSACGKLYNSELFHNIVYPVGKLYEDLGTTYKLFLLSNKVVFSPIEKYYYFQRQDSIMHFKFSKKNMDRVYLSEKLYEDVKNISDELRLAAISRMFVSNVQVLREFPFGNVQYQGEEQYIKKNIKIYRKKVLFDKRAKGINRLIALSTYFDLEGVQRLGKLYKVFYRY